MGHGDPANNAIATMAALLVTLTLRTHPHRVLDCRGAVGLSGYCRGTVLSGNLCQAVELLSRTVGLCRGVSGRGSAWWRGSTPSRSSGWAL